MEYTLGIDVGSGFIKTALVDYSDNPNYGVKQAVLEKYGHRGYKVVGNCWYKEMKAHV